MKDSTSLVILAIGFVIGVVIAKSMSYTRAYAASSNNNTQIYYGGRVITNPKLRIIFWGDFTRANPSMAQIDAQIRRAFSSTYFNALSEYKIGRPSYLGYINVRSTPRNGFDYNDMKKLLDSKYPINDYGTLYFIIPQPGLKADRGGAAFHAFLDKKDVGRAYGAFDSNYYYMDQITQAVMEETAEFAVDPYYNGWTVNNRLENPVQFLPLEMVDVCDGKTARVNGVSVTGIWSNKQNRCVFG